MTSDKSQYFGTEGNGQASAGAVATFSRGDRLPVTEMAPGLEFRPVLGARMMLSFVDFKPNTEAPLHAHDEEQVILVLNGKLLVLAGEEERLLLPGDFVIIPPWVQHSVRTGDFACNGVDIFSPPRQALIELAGLRREQGRPLGSEGAAPGVQQPARCSPGDAAVKQGPT